MKRRPLLIAAGLAATVSTVRVRAQAADLVLGQTGILSGPLGGPVKTMLAGAGLAIAEANARGGIGGRKVSLVSMDDELNPAKAVANYERLLSKQGVLAFFGCVGSGTTAAAAKLLKDSGAPMVGGYAVADSAREKVKGSGYFIRATSGREAEALVQHLTTIGITRIAVAHLDNPGGVEVLKLMNEALQAHKLTALASAGVKGDFSNAGEVAKQLAAVDPQAVLMYLGGPVGGNVMKAMWAIGSFPTFYGMSIVPGDLTFQLLGEKARGLAISQIVPYPWNQVDPQILEYRRLADAAKVPVGYYSLEGYVNALVMIDALKRAGADASRPKLHAALRATRYRIAQMSVDFTSEQLTGSRFVELVQVTHDGRFVR
jgi:ABC-type branched-subunit amino acid transport system substrate-binding protein